MSLAVHFDFQEPVIRGIDQYLPLLIGSVS